MITLEGSVGTPCGAAHPTEPDLACTLPRHHRGAHVDHATIWPATPRTPRGPNRVRAWWLVSSPEQAQRVTSALVRAGLVADVAIRTGQARVVVEHTGAARAEVAGLIRAVDLHARPVP